MVMVTRPSALRERRDPERRAARVGGIGSRPRCGRCRRSASRPARWPRRRSAAASVANSARPSPCATAIGRSEPLMPSSSTDGERSTSTSEKRASYCSLRLRHEARPVLGARDEALEGREHLAAVADAEREGVAAREEALELLAHRLVEQDRLGPALARAQHVAVGKAAAGHQALELAPGGAGRRAGPSCARRAPRSRRARTRPRSRSGC